MENTREFKIVIQPALLMAYTNQSGKSKIHIAEETNIPIVQKQDSKSPKSSPKAKTQQAAQNSLDAATSRTTNPLVSVKQWEELHKEIEVMIKVACQRCMNKWRLMIPEHFNRRAYGMYKTENDEQFFDLVVPQASGRRINVSKMKSQNYMTSDMTRENTGQLADALKIIKIDHTGATLYVTPCLNNGYDYVNPLCYGAPPGGKPYHPGWDKRAQYNDRKWGGIPDTYWAYMQQQFIKYLEEQEKILNKQIEQLLISKRIISSSVLGGNPQSRQQTSYTSGAMQQTTNYISNSPYNKKSSKRK